MRVSVRMLVRFARDFTPVFGFRIGALGLSLALSVLLARGLGPAEYGAYAFAIALFTVLQPIAAGGIGTLAIREISDPTKDSALKARTAGDLVVLSVMLAALVGGLFSLVNWAVLGGARWTLTLAVFVLPGLILVETVKGVMIGRRHVRYGQFLSEIAKPGVFLVLAVTMLSVPFITANAGMTLVLLGLSGWVVGLAALRSNLIVLPRPGTVWLYNADLIRLFRTSLPFAGVTAMQYVHTRLDILAIGHLMTDADAGHYQVATKLSQFVSMPATLVAILVAPRFVAAFGGGDLALLRRTFWFAQLASVVLALPMFLLFLLAGGWLVVMVFGAPYAPALQPMIILIFLQLALSAVANTSQIMLMCKLEKRLLQAITIGVVGNIVLNLLLIPRCGTVGAASATAIMSCVSFAMVATTLYRSRLLARDR